MKNQILALTMLTTSLLTTTIAKADEYVMKPQLQCMWRDINGVEQVEKSAPYFYDNPRVPTFRYTGGEINHKFDASLEEIDGQTFFNRTGQHILVDHLPFEVEDGSGGRCRVEYTGASLRKSYQDLLKLPESPSYKKNQSSKTENYWFYGTKTMPGFDKVFVTSVDIKKDGGWGYQNQEAIFNTIGWIVVGYEIESHWHDGTNGNWTSIDDRVIGTGKLDIPFYSKMSRGMSFTIKVYYVPSYNQIRSGRGTSQVQMWTMG